MIVDKNLANKLFANKSIVKVNDMGKIVTRAVTGTFASRAGRNSYWGVSFKEPLSDGCTGITCNFIIN